MASAGRRRSRPECPLRDRPGLAQRPPDVQGVDYRVREGGDLGHVHRLRAIRGIGVELVEDRGWAPTVPAHRVVGVDLVAPENATGHTNTPRTNKIIRNSKSNHQKLVGGSRSAPTQQSVGGPVLSGAFVIVGVPLSVRAGLRPPEVAE